MGCLSFCVTTTDTTDLRKGSLTDGSVAQARGGVVDTVRGPVVQDGGMDGSIPLAARDFVRAITRAVGTANSDNDVTTYDSAIAQLTTQPAAGRVLGDVLRSMLEDTHPDGFA